MVGSNVGLAPFAEPRAANTTRWAGGAVAWAESVGTTWHSMQSVGVDAAMEGFGFRWTRWAPSA